MSGNKEQEKDQPGSSNSEDAQSPEETPDTVAVNPSQASLLSIISRNPFMLENKNKFLRKLVAIASDMLKEQLEEEQLGQSDKFEVAVSVFSEKLNEAAEEIHQLENQK